MSASVVVGEGGSSPLECRQKGWEETINLGDVLFISEPFSWVNWSRAQSSCRLVATGKHEAGNDIEGEEVAP